MVSGFLKGWQLKAENKKSFENKFEAFFIFFAGVLISL